MRFLQLHQWSHNQVCANALDAFYLCDMLLSSGFSWLGTRYHIVGNRIVGSRLHGSVAKNCGCHTWYQLCLTASAALNGTSC